jgi:hypothetical protein
MQQADTILPVSKASSVFDGVIRLFGRSRISTPQPDEAPSNIDWPDSDPDSIQPYHGSFKQPVSGGYNEAYIVQYWASYHLR